MNTHCQPLAVELLVPAHARRISVNEHHAFRESISTNREDEHDFDDIIEIDPYVSGTSSRRSDKELNRMLAIIDSLPLSQARKAGQHE
jgi:hypothetical protein